MSHPTTLAQLFMEARLRQRAIDRYEFFLSYMNPAQAMAAQNQLNQETHNIQRQIAQQQRMAIDIQTLQRRNVALSGWAIEHRNQLGAVTNATQQLQNSNSQLSMEDRVCQLQIALANLALALGEVEQWSTQQETFNWAVDEEHSQYLQY